MEKTIIKPGRVALMRSIRDPWSLAIQNMSLEAEKACMKKFLQEQKRKRKTRNNK